MAKKKDIVIESATSAALQWHFGIVTEPPSDSRVEYKLSARSERDFVDILLCRYIVEW